MGRPKKPIRSIEKNISIPEDVCARVDLSLYSELEGRVPHGSWSRYITGLINKSLNRGEGYPKLNPDAYLALYAACKEFVRKCDTGEARSVRSYNQMLEAIKKAEGSQV